MRITKTWVPRQADAADVRVRETLSDFHDTDTPRPITVRELQDLKLNILRGDEYRANFPALDEKLFLELGSEGAWDLYHPRRPPWGQFEEVTLPEGTVWEARNPEDDVRTDVVAIDFGTSSTVVAYSEHGEAKLLLVGAPDELGQSLRVSDYENPTVLQFNDLKALMLAWSNQLYRPAIHHACLKVAYEAKGMLNASFYNPDLVLTLLTRIKHWVLRPASAKPLRIFDVNKHEVELPTSLPESASWDDTLKLDGSGHLDPIELYAYQLGLYINRQDRRRLYLEYYMTFPVTYPKEAKAGILRAFDRGLRRSLPPSLLHGDALEQFSVTEVATEPAAYAACALREHGIQATEEGTAYAVFDFGGGTTDYDFGLYRLPRGDERRMYHQVIERFGASGNEFMGSENLIEHLAYRTFLENVDQCRTERLYFQCPMDVSSVPAAAAALISSSSFARANTLMLMNKLRSLWEAPEQFSAFTSDIEVSLFTGDGHFTDFRLIVDVDDLERYMRQRVETSVEEFATAMARAFRDQDLSPRLIHLLLAGNASRSALVADAFRRHFPEMRGQVAVKAPDHAGDLSSLSRESAVAGDSPRYMIHLPLAPDSRDPYRPTGKTGVAIGLLQLVPGARLLMKSHEKEPPFKYFVGGFNIDDQFEPVLEPNEAYGQWKPLGALPGGALNLAVSQSSTARGKDRRSQDIWVCRQRFKDADGMDAYVRAVAPAVVQVCVAESEFDLPEGNADHHSQCRRLDLRELARQRS